MKEQFFGKTFWWCLLGIALAHLVAFFVLDTPIEAVIVILISLVVLALSIWKLELGLLVAFTELMVGSHGHLFSFDSFSIRMGIFVAVMLAWVVRVALKKSQYRYDDARLYPWLLLGLAVVVGGVIGWARGNDLMNVFNDMNAYFYALYLLPMLSVNWVATKRRQLLQVLSAGVTWLIVETLALLYVFSHASEGLEEVLYTFFRDARIAELTRVSGDIFRVFLQSQFWVIVGLFVLVSLCVLLWQRKQDRWLVYLGLVGSMATIVISMSRSFWLGVFIGILAALAFLFNKKKFKFIPAWKSFVGRIMIVCSAAIVSIVLLFGIVAFPFPDNLGGGGFGSLLADRATELDEAAARSRWNLVEPMMLQIKKLPFTGSGFGTVIEYESEDPRMVATGGTAETYAFEWGWLDVWLKMGFLGILAFVWLFVFYVLSLWNSAKKGDAGWLMVAFLRSVVALFVLHVFTPFLNHPIGLGFLIFLIPFLTPSEAKLSLEAVKEKMKTKKPTAQATPAMTSTTDSR